MIRKTVNRCSAAATAADAAVAATKEGGKTDTYLRLVLSFFMSYDIGKR